MAGHNGEGLHKFHLIVSSLSALPAGLELDNLRTTFPHGTFPLDTQAVFHYHEARLN